MIQNPVNISLSFLLHYFHFQFLTLLHWHESKSSQTKRWHWARARRSFRSLAIWGGPELSRMLYFFSGENRMY